MGYWVTYRKQINLFRYGTTYYITIAARSRKFSLFFCIYIQTNLNLFLLTANYICWRKEKQYSSFRQFYFYGQRAFVTFAHEAHHKAIFFVFFVTILLPTISNRWVSLLKINLLCYYVYNMWQNIINSYQLWKKRKNEIKN